MARWILALLAVHSPIWGAKWARFDGDNYQIFTDCGEKRARAASRRVEEMRTAFTGQPVALPLRVYLFASGEQFDTFHPTSLAAGFYQSGPLRDYIALPCAASVEVLGHEYTHYVLSHQFASLPVWLSEGLAEFYATAIVARDGKVSVGGPVARHLRLLEQSEWLSADELLSAGQVSRHYNERSRAGVFYAQSWLLAQYVATNELFPSFLQMIRDRVESAVAIRTAFGKEPAALLSDARRIPQGTLRMAGLPAARRDLVPVALDTVTSDLAFAELYQAAGKLDEASAIYANLADQAAPGVPTESALGAERLAAHDYDGAKRHLEKAIALGADDGETYFEYAMLRRDTGSDPRDVKALLQRAVGANPNHAEAHFVLGRMSQGEEAIGYLRKATELLPRRSAFWHALAEAYEQTGKTQLARRAAGFALDSAENQHELLMARAMMGAVAERKAPREKKPDVFVPDSWKGPRGDAFAKGTLAEVECAGGSARMRVNTEQGAVTLEVRDPSKVELLGATESRRQFTCGPQQGVRVEVEYVAATKLVVAIRFL